MQAELDLAQMQQQAQQASRLMQACAHPGRLLLLCQLALEELNVGELEQRVGLHQPSLSQQLGVLRREGLIRARRAGQQVYYQLQDPRTAELLRSLYRIFCTPMPTSPLPAGPKREGAAPKKTDHN
ncbi:metalloregulator ArsR/SmtB family transcription factor [Marinospirillum sp. MEB164]|uniref:Metalloregulator ArsR/SmtB family transcription factor n=1 Tax=Marinospirillum alkalitolerans TaxID=3123374 RepID=A0ABW8PTK6_9GAMM